MRSCLAFAAVLALAGVARGQSVRQGGGGVSLAGPTTWPGFATFGGNIRLSGVNPQLQWNDTTATFTTGGLARFVGVGGVYWYQINTSALGDFATMVTAYTIASNGVMAFGVGVATPPVAFAALPAGPVTGQRAAVTNTNACTFNTAVNGSGALFCPVIWTGAAWVGG